MPVFVPCPNIIQVEFLSTMYDFIETENVVMLRNDFPPTLLPLLTALAINLSQWHTTYINPYKAIDVVFDGAVCRPLDSIGLGGSSDFSHGGPGRGQGVGLPANCAVRIDHSTGIPGRAYRGATYFGGVPRSVVSQDTIYSGYADGLAAAWASLGPLVNAFGCTWGVLSRFEGSAPRMFGVFTPITSSAVRDYRIDSMRKRLR